jgi:DNA-binding NtrC family response regulator
MELASGGTLFLDEIGDLPLSLQVKLLRAIQEKEVQRLGDARPTPIDLRVVSATNRNLESEVSAERFRADLYYRLKVISIEVPPLRDHAEDIPELVDGFVSGIARRTGREGLRLTDPVVDLFQKYSWPGNVRELENCIEKIFALSDAAEIDLAQLPRELLRAFERDRRQREKTLEAGSGETLDWPIRYKEARDAFEQSYLRRLLKRTGGRIALAAKLSGISRRHLYDKLGKHGLDRTDGRDGDETLPES